MKSMTSHRIITAASQKMSMINNNSVNLIVTSPPYPMIKMWDEIMSKQAPIVRACMEVGNYKEAFLYMHDELQLVWQECFRVLKNGGIMCVNIGDATRTTNGKFQLFNNHSEVIHNCLNVGFYNLPNIIWRKQTNAPNKFMGSGMLPCGAYVTLEHEWILVFRKGGKRKFTTEQEKKVRRESAFLWEERNSWFSDMWEIKGAKQKLSVSGSRERNASFPLEIPYRLINMYSCKDDVVLDPFVGCGTTMLAAMLLRRNSIGVDIDEALVKDTFFKLSSASVDKLNRIICERVDNHRQFVEERINEGKEVKYPLNDSFVMTKQESFIRFDKIKSISNENESIVVEYNS